MKWTNKEYCEILCSYFQEYIGSSGDARKSVLKKIKKEIKKSANENGKEPPSELKFVRIGLLSYFKSNQLLDLENPDLVSEQQTFGIALINVRVTT
jgi:hypothetical protein